MAHEVVFISKTNSEQTKWWNEVATKLVTFKYVDNIINENTNESIGYLFEIKGMFARTVAKKLSTFVKGTDPVVIITKRLS